MNNTNRGIFLGILSALCLSVMALFVKLAAPHTTNSITILFRFAVSFSYIALIVAIGKIKTTHLDLKPHHLWLHIVRAAFGMFSMLAFYYALKFVPIMEGTLLAMTNPLFVPIIGFFLLGTKTNAKVLMAIALGFVGTIMVLRPGHDSFNIHGWYALISAICAAFSLVLLKELHRYDKPQTIMFYYFLCAFIMSAIVSLSNWHTPDLHTSLLLLAVGIFGTLYQEFMIRAAGDISAAVISCLLYLSVVFGGLFDMLFWHKFPNIIACSGLFIVVISSYFIIAAQNQKNAKNGA